MASTRKPRSTQKPRNSEVDAYAFIKEYLKLQGWDIKNPNRNLSGQVYTQTECLDHPEIKKHLGLLRPENIVKVSETEYYVIEAKREREQIYQALNEAEHDYARKINKSHIIKARIISGVAGNSTDDFIVKSRYYKDGSFHPILINEKEITGFVSPTIAKILIESDSPNIQDLPVDESIFIRAAEDINKILHIGAINKNYRARVMAALLLSMIDETRPNVNTEPNIFIGEINIRAKNVLTRNDKQAFFNHIQIQLPPSHDSQSKFKNALVKTILELENLNIRSAMNSGTDVLGKFYEVFLKYGNGAKEIGIVLTPRHITKFAADVLDINHNDIVYDPTSGTGGFLVAAFDRAKTTVETPDELNYFKENGLYGIEREPEVAALAIVNMIFRGDGRNNINEGDCLLKSLVAQDVGGLPSAKFFDNNKLPKVRTEAVTKVLMNPPFALKANDEKEYTFVNHALKQMKDGKLLFSVLPRSILVKQGRYRNWRKNLLDENTLLSVINFPEDLFYPIGVQTCGIFLKKGIPHPENQNVLWLYAKTDGLLKSKGKRLPSNRTTNDLNDKKELSSKFVINPKIQVENIRELQKATPIDFTDKLLELLPEVYLDEKQPTEEELIDKIEHTLRDTIAFMIKDDKISIFKENVLIGDFFKEIVAPEREIEWREIPITEIFEEPMHTGDFHVSGELDPGNVPLVSCASENNGFEGKFDISPEYTFKNAITIASDGQPLASFYHYYPFAAKDNVIIGIPNRNYKFSTMLFFTTQLNSLRWRFSYGRKCYLNKRHKVKIFIPFINEQLDEDYIEYLFKKSPSWMTLCTLIK